VPTRHPILSLTYTTLGSSALLLDVQVAELATRSLPKVLIQAARGGSDSLTNLDHADLLALGVVWRTSPLFRF
jgi:hypothetical protein